MPAGEDVDDGGDFVDKEEREQKQREAFLEIWEKGELGEEQGFEIGEGEEEDEVVTGMSAIKIAKGVIGEIMHESVFGIDDEERGEKETEDGFVWGERRGGFVCGKEEAGKQSEKEEREPGFDGLGKDDGEGDEEKNETAESEQDCFFVFLDGSAEEEENEKD